MNHRRGKLTGQYIYEKTFNVTNNQGNANVNRFGEILKVQQMQGWIDQHFSQMQKCARGFFMLEFYLSNIRKAFSFSKMV